MGAAAHQHSIAPLPLIVSAHIMTTNSDANMNIADRIKSDIDSALKQFGEYTMRDKGAHEVMEIDPWVEELRKLSVDETIAALNSVLEHDFGHHFVRAFLGSIDDAEEGTDPWVDGIFADESITEHY